MIQKESFEYTTRDGETVNIRYFGNGGDGIVPDTIGGRLVETRRNCTVYGCTGLTSINLPNGLLTIGNCAIDNCSGLSSIPLPSGTGSDADN